MQERVNEKTVAVAVQATKMSGRMIARIGEMYLRHVREKRRDKKLTKSRDPSTYKHNRVGKVKIRTLMQEGDGVSNVEIKDDSSADFDNTYDEILLDQQVSKKKDGITDIPIEKLHTFINHPFKVQDDEKMDELVESIRENGILSPVVVRPLDDGYELISGHRRTHAAKRAGLTSVPAVIRDLSDDEATYQCRTLI